MAVLEEHRSTETVTYGSTAFPKERVLDEFGKYWFRLVNDGFTGFGLASEGFEVFVTDHKEIRMYCKKPSEPLELLRLSGLDQVRDLTLLGPLQHYHVDLVALFEPKLSKLAEPFPNEEVDKFRLCPAEYNGFRKALVSGLEMQIQSRSAPS